MKLLYLALSITFNVLSYILYKWIAQKPHSGFWYLVFSVGLIFGAVNVLFFTKSLKSLPLNVAYPIFSGACIFAIALISHVAFGERLSLNNWVGAVLVIAGIAFLTN